MIRFSWRTFAACVLVLPLLLSLYGLGLRPATADDAQPAAAVARIFLTERVSVASDGAQSAYETNGEPVLSYDGRYVAFDSFASDLVAGDTNDDYDVFVHDRQTAVTERVSVTSDGGQGGGTSWAPAISADGNRVVFVSAAALSDGGWATWNVYLHDRPTGQTTRVNVATDGTPADQSSIDQPAISADGNVVAFTSEATNLVAGDTNNAADIFVRDLTTGQTTRVSVATGGAQASGYSASPALSADGRYVAFSSDAPDLVAGDINFATDIFRHDRQTGETILISRRLAGVGGMQGAFIPAISADGSKIAFTSRDNDFVPGDESDADIFLVDVAVGVPVLVSVNTAGEKGNSDSNKLALSADGRYVAFDSSAGNLTPDDTNGRQDVFVRDVVAGQTWRASLGTDGQQGNASSSTPGISPDGRVVGFVSAASNLVANDTNEEEDMFATTSMEVLQLFLPMVRADERQ